MDGFSSWTGQNWFNLVQTIGIIGSLWMAVGAAHRESKSREIENVLTLSEHHRELWKEILERHDLERILRNDPAILAHPATAAEQEFINLLMVHFQTGWRIAKAGGITSLNELAVDAWAFFTLPLPRAFWEKTKKFRNPQFVRFVDRAIEASGRLKPAGDFLGIFEIPSFWLSSLKDVLNGLSALPLVIQNPGFGELQIVI